MPHAGPYMISPGYITLPFNSFLFCFLNVIRVPWAKWSTRDGKQQRDSWPQQRRHLCSRRLSINLCCSCSGWGACLMSSPRTFYYPNTQRSLDWTAEEETMDVGSEGGRSSLMGPKHVLRFLFFFKVLSWIHSIGSHSHKYFIKFIPPWKRFCLLIQCGLPSASL